MPVTALTSISASPGVTSTALTWAQVNTKPTLLVEADPAGGAPLLCLAWQGAQAHNRSLLDLAHHPVGEYPQRIWDVVLQLPQRSDAWVLPGVASRAQASSFGDLWSALGDALRRISAETGIDVVIDMGRWGATGYPTSLLHHADAALIMTDTTLPALNCLSLGLEDLAKRLDGVGAAHRLAVVPLLGNEKGGKHRPYGPREIQQVTGSVPVLPGIERDVKAAGDRVWSKERQRMRWLDRLINPHSGYALSVQRLIEAASKHAASAEAYLLTQGVDLP